MKMSFISAAAAALALMVLLPGGANAVGVGKTCGGFAGLQCDAGQYCEHKPGQCGWFDMTGVCKKTPFVCPRITGPTIQVCGCNGQTYINNCEREKAMVSLDHKGACK